MNEQKIVDMLENLANGQNIVLQALQQLTANVQTLANSVNKVNAEQINSKTTLTSIDVSVQSNKARFDETKRILVQAISSLQALSNSISNLDEKQNQAAQTINIVDDNVKTNQLRLDDLKLICDLNYKAMSQVIDTLSLQVDELNKEHDFTDVEGTDRNSYE